MTKRLLILTAVLLCFGVVLIAQQINYDKLEEAARTAVGNALRGVNQNYRIAIVGVRATEYDWQVLDNLRAEIEDRVTRHQYKMIDRKRVDEIFGRGKDVDDPDNLAAAKAAGADAILDTEIITDGRTNRLTVNILNAGNGNVLSTGQARW